LDGVFRISGLEPEEIQYLTEMGIDLSALKTDEKLSSRMNGIRTLLKDMNTYTKNPANKTSVERMVQRAYSPFEKTKKADQTRGEAVKSRQETLAAQQEAARKTAESRATAMRNQREKKIQDFNHWISPFEKPSWNRPMTYPRAIVWDLTTKKIIDVFKKHPAESVGTTAGIIWGMSLANPVLVPILGLTGYGMVKAYKYFAAGKKDDGHGHGGGH
jgi:hypothetical protein